MFNTRRDMLKWMGIAPFLAPAFRDVFAASDQPIKRAVFMIFHTGYASEYWYPSGANKGTMNLAGTSLESLSPVKNKVSIIQNLTNNVIEFNPGDRHQSGPNAAFAAQTTSNEQPQTRGVSLDQHIINKTGIATTRRNMTFALCNSNTQPVFWRARGSPADRVHSPYAAINDLFGTFINGKPDASAPTPVNNLALRRSILDGLSGDLTRMSKRLAGPERQKLEAHLSFVRASELKLGKVMGPPTADSCTIYTAPAVQLNVGSTDNLPQLGEIFTEVIAMAMACDICRIFSLEFTQSNPQASFNWPGIGSRDSNSVPGDLATGLHFLAHSVKGDPNRELFGKVNGVYVNIFASLLKKLDARPDGTGTLLDNSVSVLANAYGDSPDHVGGAHDWHNTPYIIGGLGGGYYKGGQNIDAGGKSHTQVLGSVLEAFNIDRSASPTASGDGAFGDPGFSYDSLPGLKA